MYHSKYIPRKVKEIVMEILSSVYVGFPTIFVLLDSWEEIWQVMDGDRLLVVYTFHFCFIR